MTRQIPVFLFTGFLEAGKTTFLQKTLEDASFNSGKARIMVLLCEEGVEELQPESFASDNVCLETVENESDLTPANLRKLLRKNRADYVIVEYNGMWSLDTLYGNMPEGWGVAQELFFADARSFIAYNTNVRQLTVDKMQSCELAVFNRFPEGDEELKLQIHKIVTAINRRCQIAFETADGKTFYDDIEIPLPYDLTAPVAEIADADYAIFFQDILEQAEKYVGKTVSFKGRTAIDPKGMAPGHFFFGRKVMRCCEADISFMPLAAEWKNASTLKNLSWYQLTATISMGKSELYEEEGPILHVLKMERTEAPEQEVATFY